MFCIVLALVKLAGGVVMHGDYFSWWLRAVSQAHIAFACMAENHASGAIVWALSCSRRNIWISDIYLLVVVAVWMAV